MKSNVRIAANWLSYTFLELIDFTDHIYDSMNGNLNFPKPSPELVVLQAANAELKKAAKAQRIGDKLSTTKVSDARYEVETILKFLAGYVEYTSKTDEAVALSSGFELKKNTSRSSSKEFTAKQGETGTVELSIPHVKNSCYIWEFGTDPRPDAENWKQGAISTFSKATIKGLTPGTHYWFRVATVIGTRQGPFSEPIHVHVI